MKVAIMACLFAKWDVKIDTGQRFLFTEFRI
jgi:hypothetical protein